jgi:hypothetical protein
MREGYDVSVVNVTTIRSVLRLVKLVLYAHNAMYKLKVINQ